MPWILVLVQTARFSADAAYAAADAWFAAYAITDATPARFAAYAAAHGELLADIQRIASGDETSRATMKLLSSPLWSEGMPFTFHTLWRRLQSDLLSLKAGFEVWVDWYQDRLDGRPFDWNIERQWAELSKEQLSQAAADINAYLKALRGGSLTKQLKRVRAIFIGHGEAGKTSLIKALHGEEVIEGKEAMTKGVATTDLRW